MTRTVRRRAAAATGDSRNRGRPVGVGRPLEPTTACRPPTTVSERRRAHDRHPAGRRGSADSPDVRAKDDHRAGRRSGPASVVRRDRGDGATVGAASGSPRCASAPHGTGPAARRRRPRSAPGTLRRGRRHHLGPITGASGEHRPARGGDHVGRADLRADLRAGDGWFRGRRRRLGRGQPGVDLGRGQRLLARPEQARPDRPHRRDRPTTRAAPTAAAHAATPATTRVARSTPPQHAASSLWRGSTPP